MKKTKWLIYTVLIGLIPLFIRFFIYIISIDKPFTYVLNEVDIVTFGLILQLTNINELDDNETFEKSAKTAYFGLSIFFLILFAAFLGVTYFSENLQTPIVSKDKIKYLSISMGIASFVMSYSINHRLNAINQTNNDNQQPN